MYYTSSFDQSSFWLKYCLSNVVLLPWSFFTRLLIWSFVVASKELQVYYYKHKVREFNFIPKKRILCFVLYPHINMYKISQKSFTLFLNYICIYVYNLWWSYYLKNNKIIIVLNNIYNL